LQFQQLLVELLATVSVLVKQLVFAHPLATMVTFAMLEAVLLVFTALVALTPLLLATMVTFVPKTFACLPLVAISQILLALPPIFAILLPAIHLLVASSLQFNVFLTVLAIPQLVLFLKEVA